MTSRPAAAWGANLLATAGLGLLLLSAWGIGRLLLRPFVGSSGLSVSESLSLAIGLGLVRQLLAPVAVIWLLAWPLGLGTSGIWWGVFVVNWAAALFTWWYVLRVLKAAQADQARG